MGERGVVSDTPNSSDEFDGGRLRYRVQGQWRQVTMFPFPDEGEMSLDLSLLPRKNAKFSQSSWHSNLTLEAAVWLRDRLDACIATLSEAKHSGSEGQMS